MSALGTRFNGYTVAGSRNLRFQLQTPFDNRSVLGGFRSTLQSLSGLNGQTYSKLRLQPVTYQVRMYISYYNESGTLDSGITSREQQYAKNLNMLAQLLSSGTVVVEQQQPDGTWRKALMLFLSSTAAAPVYDTRRNGADISFQFEVPSGYWEAASAVTSLVSGNGTKVLTEFAGLNSVCDELTIVLSNGTNIKLVSGLGNYTFQYNAAISASQQLGVYTGRNQLKTIAGSLFADASKAAKSNGSYFALEPDNTLASNAPSIVVSGLNSGGYVQITGTPKFAVSV